MKICEECAGKSCGPKGIAACKQQMDDADYNQRREWYEEGREDEDSDPETEREMFDWATGGVR